MKVSIHRPLAIIAATMIAAMTASAAPTSPAEIDAACKGKWKRSGSGANCVEVCTIVETTCDTSGGKIGKCTKKTTTYKRECSGSGTKAGTNWQIRPGYAIDVPNGRVVATPSAPRPYRPSFDFSRAVDPYVNGVSPVLAPPPAQTPIKPYTLTRKFE